VHPTSIDDADGDGDYDEVIATIEDDIASEDESGHRNVVSVPRTCGSTDQANPSEQKTVTPRQTSPLRKAWKGRSHDKNDVVIPELL